VKRFLSIRPGPWALCLAVCLMAVTGVVAQERTGEILGTVVDQSGAPIPGATVSAESPSLPRSLQTVTDGQGRYHLFNVPVGTYTLTISLSGFKTEKQSVEVQLGSQITVNPKLTVGQVTEVIEVTGSTLSIQSTSSRVATNITTDQIENLAKATRTFQSLLPMAPGVFYEPKNGTAGVGGIQIAGSSGAENAFYIDGAEVSDLRRGSLRDNNAIPVEFIQEIQVKSGGFEAEFGGATGGVINVATRSGSNEYHGAIGFSYTGSALNSPDRGFYQRSPLNADAADFFKPKEDDYSIWSPTASFGGPILRDRLHFFGAYSPDLESTTRVIDYTTGARTFEQTRRRHFSIARLDYSPSARLQLNGSYLWSPAKRNGALPNRDPRVAAPSNDQSIQGGFTPAQTASASINWTPSSKLILSARYGYKYLNDKDGNYGIPTAPYITYQTASSRAGVSVPVPGGSGFSTVSNTLTTVLDTTTRHNVYLDATYVMSAHTFKAGYALNRLANEVSTDFPDGRFLIYWGDAFSRASIQNATGTYGYYTWEDGVRNSGAVTSRNQSLYAQDTWRLGRNLTLNLGVRVENEFLPPFKPEVNGIKVANPVSFGWGDKIAPRAGFAWDMKGDGRSKLSGSFGLFYDTLKYELARGSFGSDFWVTHVYRLNDADINKLHRSSPGALGPEITNYDNRELPINAQGELEGIDPNIKPYQSLEGTIAFDRQFKPHWVGGIRYTHRDLLRAIEDIGVLNAVGSEVYLIGNPGFGETRDTSSVYGGQAPNGTFLVPKAKRHYDAVELRTQGQFFGKLNVLASYTYSRLFGNYSGSANSDESGRQDPGVSRAFDLPYYYFDASGSQEPKEGYLATDRPHAFKLFAYYQIKSGLGTTNIGLNQLLLSGTPDSTSVIYLSAPTFPFGRGDLGRTPAYSQTDLTLTHSFKLTKGANLRLEANVRNLFDQDTVISRVTQINRSGAISAASLPLSRFFAGYNLANFVNPQNNTGSGVPYNPIYGLAGASYRAGGGPGTTFSSAYSARFPNFGAYQDFRTIRLGMTLTF
jgi:Carboxypeptidase regulatory-like domain/TonB-dependent Receptor Plug Domain